MKETISEGKFLQTLQALNSCIYLVFNVNCSIIGEIIRNVTISKLIKNLRMKTDFWRN